MTAILFDLDGTLHDSEWVSFASYDLGMAEFLGRTLTQEEKDFLVGKPVLSMLGQWFPGREQDVRDEIIRHYEAIHERITPYAGVVEMLTALRQAGVPVGIVTSKMKRFVGPELGFTGLDAFFAVIVTWDDCGEHKPSPGPLLQAARALGVSPGDCFYVGDQPTDLQAARAAGMAPVGALWGEGKRERLAPLAPAHLLTQPAELLRLAGIAPSV